MIPEWKSVKKLCKQQIEYARNVCCDPDTDEKTRLVTAGELRAYEYILMLQVEEANLDHE